MFGLPLDRWIRPGSTLALALLGVGLAGLHDARPGEPRDAAWPEGQPVPIAVTRGHCRFQVPTPSGAPTLVIVSTLAQRAGPYAIRLSAHATHAVVASPAPRDAAQPGPTPSLAPVPPADEPAPVEPSSERTFHLLVRDGDVASASNYLAVQGVLRAVGRRVQVYVDSADVANVGAEAIGDLVATFDHAVFPTASRHLGQARDVDGDGRFTVLISGWLTRLGGGKHAVDGFVRGADLDLQLEAPFSNHCDMMYLSPALKAGPYLRTVVAHEYMHAVINSVKAFRGRAGERTGLEEEGWLDEGLAHLGEDLHGFSRANIDYRVSAFLSNPERYRLVVDDYFAADLFRSHGNRGGTYLFLRWCADRFGPGLLPTLIRSEQRGTANLEAATGVPFAELYRRWSVALFATGFDPAHASDDRFQSIDTRSSFGAWCLAGPRVRYLESSGATDVWSAAGTSSHYVIVPGVPNAAVDVQLHGPADAELQVTAVPLPTDLPRMALSVHAGRGPAGQLQLRASVRETEGVSVRLSALAWEPLAPAPDPRSTGLHCGGLSPEQVASSFGTIELPANGRLDSRPIVLADPPPDGTPVIVKAIGTDAKGRRITAWADFVFSPALTNDPSTDDFAARLP